MKKCDFDSISLRYLKANSAEAEKNANFRHSLSV